MNRHPRHPRAARWTMGLQIAALAIVLVAFPAHLLDRAARGVTECRALQAAQCPDFLK